MVFLIIQKEINDKKTPNKKEMCLRNKTVLFFFRNKRNLLITIIRLTFSKILDGINVVENNFFAALFQL